MNYEFLILGVGRSGTAYISKLFTNLGYPIGHEKIKDCGISSWLFAVVPSKHHIKAPTWGPFREGSYMRKAHGRYHTPDFRKKNDKFNHIISVVRDPIHVIRSIVNAPPLDRDEWRRQFITIDDDLNLIGEAVQTYIEWNKLIINQTPDLTIKLENAHNTIPDFLLKNNFSLPESIEVPPNNTNTKGKITELSLNVIKRLIPSQLFIQLKHEIEFYEHLK